jgi:hypothetical protein
VFVAPVKLRLILSHVVREHPENSDGADQIKQEEAVGNLDLIALVIHLSLCTLYAAKA